MANVAELNESFGMEGVLVFDEPQAGMTRARVTTPSCTAELYLYGAHLAEWQPAGTEPALFMSPRSLFVQGKPIRGGVPVIYPWFGPRSEQVTGGSTEGPAHGFARTQEWDLVFAGLTGEDVHLALHLTPSAESRAMGFDHFRVALEFTLGRELTMRMAVANEGDEPLVFEQALHTYFRVSDVAQVKLEGLGGTEFLDKVDNFARKRQQENVLTIAGQTDRVYLNTRGTVTVEDPGWNRRIVVEKGGSDTTVVWNPWGEASERLADLGPEVWHEFVCVETVNAGENRIRLASRAAHLMETRVRVEQR